MNKKNIFSIFYCMFIFCSTSFSQNENLKLYIPHENSSYNTHPVISIKAHVHIIKKDQFNAENLTEDSTEYINKQYLWINNIYKNLKNPSLLPVPKGNGLKNEFYVPDSRIRFVIDTISYYTNKDAWERMYMGVAVGGKFPWEIIEIDLEKNEVIISGRWDSFLKSKTDSLILGSSSVNDGVYHRTSVHSMNNRTYIKMQEKLKKSNSLGNITFFRKIDKNCHSDNWKNLANEDKSHLHIFYTSSTMEVPAFGCGPSPYYLNISRVIHNGDYATAQLTAHELGHCLGLRHTDYPQFDDLPPNDKFGWIKCNSTNTSNNIMGYNLCRNYLSPKQIGYIHYRYSNDINLINLTSNGDYNKNKTIEIWDDTTWNKSILISGDIIIRAYNTLTVKSMLSMAENSSIYIEKQAKLIIDGTVITNNHNKLWNGIVFCKSYERRYKKTCRKYNPGTLEILNNGKIENVVID